MRKRQRKIYKEGERRKKGEKCKVFSLKKWTDEVHRADRQTE